MKNEISKIRDPELRFFLPTTEGLQNEWKSDQLLYCECCRHGAYKIASAIKGGAQASVKALYDIAADTRYRTAQLMQYPKDEFPYYGVYHYPYSDRSLVVDPIENDKNSRWGNHFSSILKKLEGMCRSATSDPNFAEKHYGNNYMIEMESNTGRWTYSLRYRLDHSKNILISKITHQEDNLITLKHVPTVYLPWYFGFIQKSLDQTVSISGNHLSVFIDHLLKFRQLLFHSTPLTKGSQSATQMVIAGIIISKGFELVPLIPVYDHFLDAEVFTHREYAERRLAHFEYLPSTTDKSQMNVDNNFFDEEFRIRDRSITGMYSSINSLEEKVEYFLLSSIYVIKKFHEVTKLDINKINLVYDYGVLRQMRIKCSNKQNEQIANKAIHFFGIKTVLKRIGEEHLYYKSANKPLQ